MSIFTINPALASDFHRSADGKRVLKEAADVVAANAIELAPEKTGDYKASIQAETTADGARVIAHDFKAGWIEFGTGGSTPTPAFAPLRRGAEAAGLKVEAKRVKS